MKAADAIRFTIRGARSGVPLAAGCHFGRYTTCFTLEVPGAMLMIDAGTGLMQVQADLAAAPRRLTLLLTHGHFDHLSGLASFAPLYTRSAQAIRVLAAPSRLASVRRAVREMLSPPLWPVAWPTSSKNLRFSPLPPAGQPLRFGAARITWCPVWHPQGSLALRIEAAGRVLVVATDREPGRPALDRRFRDFCRQADWLVVDAQYTPEEALARRGWGHGNWLEAATLAHASEVGALILTHHDQMRNDVAIHRIVQSARRIFPRTVAATEQMAFTFNSEAL